MKIKPFIYKGEGCGIAFWYKNKYFSIWLHWANGIQCLPHNKKKILWTFPFFEIKKVKLNYDNR